jgi:D-3-phosphoglycerate dehydrogenase
MPIPARLVYERWTHPVAGERLDGARMFTVDQLDIAGPPAAGWDLLRAAHGYQVAIRTACAQVPDGEQWLADRTLIERCGNLLAVTSAGAGYDVIDVDACTQAGVIACNNSGPGAEAVAEHALGLMLALAKKIVVSDRAMRIAEVRDRAPLRSSELLGKTLGVVGFGAIGRRLVELCHPFRMEVLVHDPFVAEEALRAAAVRRVSFDELLDRADYVQVTCPLTPDTAGLFGRDAFTKMRPTAHFITTARGEVHDEEALVEALASGSIAGAGVDVFHTEPVPTDHPLLQLPNVIATPHVAGITDEATHGLAVATAEQWIEIFSGRVPGRLINPEAWPRYQDRFESAFGFRPDDLPTERREG